MVTLKDVAIQAGVSVATVSYYVNGTKSVSQKTKIRIQKAIEDLNYVPNYAARSLKSEGVKEIGVVFPDIDDNYRSEILKGIIDCAEHHNYTVAVAFTYNSPIMEQKVLKDFIGKNLRGLIINTCQQDNKEFFQKNINDRGISSVFIERCPKDLPVNFCGFDNYKCYHDLTLALLKKGYRHISVLEGPVGSVSVEAAVNGFVDAYEEMGIEYKEEWIVHTDTTKESSFRECMKKLVIHPPQALITYSDTVLKGGIEAFRVYGIELIECCCVITMGEDTWNCSDIYPGVHHVSRMAYTMGDECTNLLFNNIEEHELFEPVVNLIPDHLESVTNSIPDPINDFHMFSCIERKQKLKILTYPLMTMTSLQLMAENFSVKTGIGIEFEECSVSELSERIVSEKRRNASSFDLCQYDVYWLDYLVSSGALKDISEIMENRPDLRERFMEKNIANCYKKGHCYGIPVIGGTQLLFYRRDLFENSTIQRQFMKQHHLTLRPPKTWTAYNGIAKFFTKEFNQESPTEYGALLTSSPTQDMIVEIMVRLWSFGGDLTDSKGKLALNTPHNVRAFNSLLETCKYAYDGGGASSLNQLFNEFGTGKFAMMLSFSEYASRIMDQIHGDTVSKIGYSMIPGQVPANVGWNIGVNPKTQQMEKIAAFFDWMTDRQNSFYLSILSGQSVAKAPHKNHEMLRLYPWLNISEEGQKSSKSRQYPYKGSKRMVSPSEIESVLQSIFFQMREDPDRVSDYLIAGQRRIEKLFV